MVRVKVDLKGKVAFVTGGGSGIGRGIALQLAHDGAAAVVADLNGDTAAGVAAEIKAIGGESLGLALDVTDSETINDAVRTILTQFGQLDFVFANAGVLGPADLMTTSSQEWDQVLDVNIKGVVHTCQAVVPHMMERCQGRIIITASYNGVRPGVHVIPYRVSKAAVLMYTRSLALLMAPYQVTVNAICPGVTLTPMQIHYAQKTAAERGITLEDYLANRTERVPMQQLTEIEDLTGLVEFLVSDSARLITGQAIAPDGGVMMS